MLWKLCVKFYVAVFPISERYSLTPIDFASLVGIVLIVLVMTLFRYILYRRQRLLLLEEKKKTEEFLKYFDPAFFTDFSLFEFELNEESFVAPFPRKVNEEWRYTIHLAVAEVEDYTTITHEVTECTIGRLIERLLSLNKPLYLQRKEKNKFWVHGKRQKYLLEHMVTTLSEIGRVENKKLKERLAKEDFEEIMRKFN